tara:strand:+ start:553 stop:744 length:192 start_codon:yes stop_codon:yes gene_type:complete
MTPLPLVPDEDVNNVEKSIAAAEDITGNKLPEPEAEKASFLAAQRHSLVGLSADNMFIPQSAM